MVRLQKYLSEAGIASRRASEEIIRAGRVKVNGQIVQTLGTKVLPDQDRVEVDGRLIKPRRKLYIALNKPPGFLCTRKDPLERRTVSELLPAEWTHLASVGRLDRDSEGLLLLTNDGEFALRLTHPRYGVRKLYRATVEGRVEPPMLQKFLTGVEDAGELLKVEKARLISANNSQSVVELELGEGRNREVRRLFSSQGYTVTRLQRTQIGRIKLGELPVGKWRTLTPAEVQVLLSATPKRAELPTRHPSANRQRESRQYQRESPNRTTHA
jgi:23S rRNA pseudouridine2605 synthase